MAKKVSKWFRIGVEGDTCDGRVISGDDIQEMADSFDPRVYGCRINLEHPRGILPDSVLKRYGDVTEVKAEIISDDSALNGKRRCLAKSHRWTNWSAWCAAVRKFTPRWRSALTSPTAANVISLAWR